MGLNPTQPHKAAGWRMEPPVSVPSAAMHSSAATAAAEPPEEPPGMRRGVPRIAGDAEGGILRGTAHGKLIHVQAAKDNRAGLPAIFQ